MSKGMQIAIGVVLVLALFSIYAARNLDGLGSFTYYETLDEFLALGESKKRVRVHGFVSNGSIQRDVKTKQVHFAIQNEAPHAGGAADQNMTVVFHSLEVPDLFRDGAEVVVEGQLQRDRDELVFHADNVLAKCPSKFEAQSKAEATL